MSEWNQAAFLIRRRRPHSQYGAWSSSLRSSFFALRASAFALRASAFGRYGVTRRRTSRATARHARLTEKGKEKWEAGLFSHRGTKAQSEERLFFSVPCALQMKRNVAFLLTHWGGLKSAVPWIAFPERGL